MITMAAIIVDRRPKPYGDIDGAKVTMIGTGGRRHTDYDEDEDDDYS